LHLLEFLPTIAIDPFRSRRDLILEKPGTPATAWRIETEILTTGFAVSNKLFWVIL
jgi:hypothetical protein